MTDSAKLTWLPKKTFEVEFSLPWEKVKTVFESVMKELIKETNIKGFRKGKAPRELVEKSVDKGKIYGEVINQLLPLSYAAAVKQHGLKPAISPKITILAAEEGQAWQFKAKSCELPEIKLKDYQASAKGALSQSKLWTPEKGQADIKPKELTPGQKLNLVAQALLTDTPIELPEMLLESERDRLLANLLAELQKLGLSLEQYAGSNQKTVEQIKQEYQTTAANTLKLELILQAIADDLKIKISDAEVDKMIAQSGDEHLKKQLNTPSQRAYIRAVLRKKQAIDFLVGLG